MLSKSQRAYDLLNLCEMVNVLVETREKNVMIYFIIKGVYDQ